MKTRQTLAGLVMIGAAMLGGCKPRPRAEALDLDNVTKRHAEETNHYKRFADKVLSYYNKDNMPEKLKGLSPEMQKEVILYVSLRVTEPDPGFIDSVPKDKDFEITMGAYLAKSAGIKALLMEAVPKDKDEEKETYLLLDSGYRPNERQKAEAALKQLELEENVELKEINGTLYLVLSPFMGMFWRLGNSTLTNLKERYEFKIKPLGKDPGKFYQRIPDKEKVDHKLSE